MSQESIGLELEHVRQSHQLHRLEISVMMLDREVSELRRRQDLSETSQHIVKSRDDSRRLSTVELSAKIGLALLLPLLVLLLTGNENAAKLAGALIR